MRVKLRQSTAVSWLPLLASLFNYIFAAPASAQQGRPGPDVFHHSGSETDAKALPPFIELPLDVIEPPRDVKAADWRSPYCRRWSDGCTDCERAKIGAPSECRSAAQNNNSECKRQPVVCSEAIDIKLVNRICHEYLEGVLAYDDHGGMLALGMPSESNWSFYGGRWSHGDQFGLDDGPKMAIAELPAYYSLNGTLKKAYDRSKMVHDNNAPRIFVCFSPFN